LYTNTNISTCLFTLFLSITLLLFIIIRSTPLSPLFPYTTLFRSPALAAASRSSALHCCFFGRWKWREPIFVECPAAFECPAPHLDRKSTRLNSSHEWNSYAVFCLKKKI